MNIQSHDGVKEEVQHVTNDNIINAPLDTLSSPVTDTSFIMKTDETLTVSGEKDILVFFYLILLHLICQIKRFW